MADAGEGRLEVMVECNDETIPSKVEESAVGQFTASFVPRTGGPHKISVTFNDEHVHGTNNIFTF